jgi:nucleotide-binding universal stress UspA family protein
MYRLIQVPLDGSSFAEQALPLAVGLAAREGAALELVHVHAPIAGVYLDRPGTYEAGLDAELMERMRNYLESVIKRFAGETDIDLRSTVLKGPVAETIARYAVDSAADLLVMTTHGRRPLGRLWFGSIAGALVRQATIPILFARSNQSLPDFGQQPILVPLDGSELAEQAVERAIALGGHDKGSFSLLRVTPAVLPVAYEPSNARMSGLRNSLVQQLHDLTNRQHAEAHDDLERVAAALRRRSLAVQTRVVAHEQPAVAILEAVSACRAGAIALSTRGRGGFKRLILGSTANRVLRDADVPVLVCPPLMTPNAHMKGVRNDTTTHRQQPSHSEPTSQAFAVLGR